jgi:hypothetical protein
MKEFDIALDIVRAAHRLYAERKGISIEEAAVIVGEVLEELQVAAQQSVQLTGAGLCENCSQPESNHPNRMCDAFFTRPRN